MKSFTVAQTAALKHPFLALDVPPLECVWIIPANRQIIILTCDFDEETIRNFGGPCWHISISPPNPERAESYLEGIGHGPLFRVQDGVRDDVYHLRRRMIAHEIAQTGAA